ncbi:phage tail P2-like protein [Marinobacter sp. 3-2]|jgi:phage tail P2-like protein|uniref:phage tail protein I n=1 Tax=Marinobacter sp. 3-2 TaxID=2485141 RepID=UPI000D39FB03|nr:phage tail protein I [Marinobacter sp. 3-2]ROQ39331.1 phage tail P2-like protein [Marinobacter sp. 3-2]
MSEPTSLLPNNSTPLERAAAEALAEIQRVPVPIRTLWNPYNCPAKLLPYLAWAFSVDRWDAAWSEAAKREVIATSFYIHKKKGTIGAIRRVVEPLGYPLTIKEWWQTEPAGTRGTFTIKIAIPNSGITEEMYQEIERLIDDAKPVSRHIDRLDLAGESTGQFYFGLATYDGDVTAVLPYQPIDTEVTGHYFLGASTDSNDSATVYPL